MNRRRRYFPILVCVVSLVGVFYVGASFDLFGKKIDFAARPENHLFFGMIYLGVFGAMGVFFRYGTAFATTVIFAGLTLGLFIAGKFTRGEL